MLSSVILFGQETSTLLPLMDRNLFVKFSSRPWMFRFPVKAWLLLVISRRLTSSSHLCLMLFSSVAWWLYRLHKRLACKVQTSDAVDYHTWATVQWIKWGKLIHGHKTTQNNHPNQNHESVTCLLCHHIWFGQLGQATVACWLPTNLDPQFRCMLRSTMTSLPVWC